MAGTASTAQAMGTQGAGAGKVLSNRAKPKEEELAAYSSKPIPGDDYYAQTAGAHYHHGGAYGAHYGAGAGWTGYS